MKTIDGYLSKQAQKIDAGWIVTRDDEADGKVRIRYVLERVMSTNLGLGNTFAEAKASLEALKRRKEALDES